MLPSSAQETLKGVAAAADMCPERDDDDNDNDDDAREMYPLLVATEKDLEARGD
eukprot:CAMPEP_0171629686 /NCGR_PEP_ID=MMETSP0990-20121206/22355_1 /TAXON_ID=483369 /ORGANISM="non described non described, Strain CCMP2098" /LENGTH=53 /DNA_ID=CAMNT_0012198459 /DNA_START=76 /DNA_END=237 /DNA_ORIENTATION=+